MSRANRRNKRRVVKEPTWRKDTFKHALKTAGLLLVVCALAAGIPYGAYSYYGYLVEQDYFAPKDIRIHGNIRVSDQEILEYSGLLEEGVNLFEMDSFALKERIMQVPWIDQVNLTFHLPDALEIHVIEKEALGIVNDKHLYIVDMQGNPIKILDQEDALMHPIVSGTGILSQRQDIILQAFEMARSIDRTDFGERVDEIHYDDATGFTLFTQNSEIRIGYDRFEERLERLTKVSDILHERSVIADYILLDSDNKLDEVILSARPKVKTDIYDTPHDLQAELLAAP